MPNKFEYTCSLITDVISADIDNNQSDYSKNILLLKENIDKGRYFEELLTGLKEQLEFDDVQLYILSLSAIFCATKEIVCLDMIRDALLENRLSLVITRAIAFQIRVRCFQMGIARDYNSEKILNDNLADRFYRELNIDIPYIEYPKRNHNLVVLTTHTLLNIKHAPTKWVLSVAYILQELGYEVLIVIEGEPITPESICAYWIGEKYYTKYGYNYGTYCLDINDKKVQCYQINLNQSSHNEIIKAIEAIYSLRPEFVWKIGGGFSMDHIWSKMSTYVTLPCAKGYDPCIGDLMIKCLEAETDSEVENIIQSTGASTMHMSFKEIEFKDPCAVERDYRRSDYNINDDDFVVAVVGNRLNDEISKDFWKVLERIISQKDNIKVILIGKYNGVIPDSIKADVIYCGYCEPLESAIRMADLFVNPKRNGGGTSAKMCLKNMIPIVTLQDCDVANTVGDCFVVDDYDEMIKMVIRYVDDRKFYKKQVEGAAIRYSKCFDVDMRKEIRRVVDRAIEIAQYS